MADQVPTPQRDLHPVPRIRRPVKTELDQGIIRITIPADQARGGIACKRASLARLLVKDETRVSVSVIVIFVNSRRQQMASQGMGEEHHGPSDYQGRIGTRITRSLTDPDEVCARHKRISGLRIGVLAFKRTRLETGQQGGDAEGPNHVALSNGSRLSCGALKKDSFHNLQSTRAASFKRLLGGGIPYALVAPCLDEKPR